jgi:hypothetical protein
VDSATAVPDASLPFLSFPRDPHQQCVPRQRRLASVAAVTEHLVHTGVVLATRWDPAQAGSSPGFFGG